MISVAAIAAWSVAAQNGPQFEKTVRAAMASSLDQQRASVQKQVSTALATVSGAIKPAESDFYTIPWPEPIRMAASSPSGPDCDPLPKPELDRLVQEASERQGLSADLISAVIGKESAAKPCAISPKGAQGLMQLMPSTADLLGVTDPFDPRQNVDGGTRLLKQLLTKYSGDVALALGAYNAGSGRVDREGGVPNIPETVNYVSDILGRFRIQ